MISRRAFGARLLRAAVLAGTAISFASAGEAEEGLRSHPPAHWEANAVVQWNSIAGEAFAPSQGTNPMAQSRTLAILHAAIHDALNAIERRYASYTPGVPDTPGASVDAAVATAAREVLVKLVPDQTPHVEAACARALAGVRDGPAKAAGIATGQAAARATLERRQGDGFDAAMQLPYVPRSGPGEYQFTAPFDFAAQPGWGRVQPFVITLGEHAVDGPQPVTSVQYAQVSPT